MANSKGRLDAFGTKTVVTYYFLKTHRNLDTSDEMDHSFNH